MTTAATTTARKEFSIDTSSIEESMYRWAHDCDGFDYVRGLEDAMGCALKMVIDTLKAHGCEDDEIQDIVNQWEERLCL